jgi:hypothetical protein
MAPRLLYFLCPEPELSEQIRILRHVNALLGTPESPSVGDADPLAQPAEDRAVENNLRRRTERNYHRVIGQGHATGAVSADVEVLVTCPSLLSIQRR